MYDSDMKTEYGISKNRRIFPKYSPKGFKISYPLSARYICHFVALANIFYAYDCFDIAISKGNAGKTPISKIGAVFAVRQKSPLYEMESYES